MSIQSLLEPDTKLQPWSSLYCYHLEAANISADQIEKGALAPTIDQITNANITFTQGSGTVENSHSMISRYHNGTGDTNEYIFCTGSFNVTNAAAPVESAGQCLFLINIVLPFKIGSPGGAPINVAGGTSVMLRDLLVYTSTGTRLLNNAGDLRLEVVAFRDIAAASATRTLNVSYTVHYRRV